MNEHHEQSRTLATYELQWNRFRIVREEEDRATFRNRTGLNESELRGAEVLDAGCGMARYARIALSGEPRRLVGLDLSWSLRAAREVLAEQSNWGLVRGDLLRLPLREGTFDHIYSIGVLDHTPDPRGAFLGLARLLKPGGRIAIWVYERERAVLEFLKDAHRAVSTRLPLPVLMEMSRLAAPVGGWKRRMMGSRVWPVQRLGVALHLMTLGVSMHPDAEVRVCDTLDWYAPKYMSRHTRDEVRGWFAEAGLENIIDLSVGQRFYHAGQGNGVNFAGTRPR